MPHALREVFSAFRRTPLLIFLSVLAVGLSLFVIGLFALTAYNIRQAIAQIESRVEVVAYLANASRSSRSRARSCSSSASTSATS